MLLVKATALIVTSHSEVIATLPSVVHPLGHLEPAVFFDFTQPPQLGLQGVAPLGIVSR